MRRRNQNLAGVVLVHKEIYNIVIKNTVLITFVVMSLVLMRMFDYMYFVVYCPGDDLEVFVFFMLTMDAMIQCGCILLMFSFSNIVYDKLCVEYHLMCINCGMCCGHGIFCCC